MKNLFLSVLAFFFLLGCAHSPGPTSRFPAQIAGVSDHLSCLNHFMALMSYSPSYNPKALNSPTEIKLAGLKTPQDFEDAYGGWSFFSIQQEMTPANIRKFNKGLLKALETDDVDEVSTPGSVTRLSMSEARQFYKDFKKNPISSCYLQYEKPGVTVGFCFARASIAHVEALRRGVDTRSVKKIWVIGDMGHWGHHVATMIKTEEGWMVFDDIFGFVTPRDWIAEMELHTEGKQLMYFASSAERFGPASNSSYSPVDLFGTEQSDYYNGFFKDYFNWVKDQPEATPFAGVR